MFHPEKYFDLEGYIHRDLFDGIENVWEVFVRSEKYLEQIFEKTPVDQRILGDVHPQAIIKGDVIVAQGAKIEPTAYIEGPVYIGQNSIVGTGAYVRGLTITGKNCVIGHCTEARNTILLDHAWAPHFNFIGDSVLGAYSNIGAGVIFANYRFDEKDVPVGETTVGTAKFGAVIGDGVKIGCNTVLEPGTFVQKNVWIGPTQYVLRGVYEKGERHVDVVRIDKK